jgi:hypothetical protein
LAGLWLVFGTAPWSWGFDQDKEHLMSDDKTKTGPQDASRINVNEDYEVDYWTKALGVSAETLRRAVDQVGVSADAVRAHLARGAH